MRPMHSRKSVPRQMVDSFELDKEENNNKHKKIKKKHGVSNSDQHEGSCTEAAKGKTIGNEDADYSDGLKANKHEKRHKKSRNEDRCDVVETKKEDVAETENGEGEFKRKNKRKRHEEEDDDRGLKQSSDAGAENGRVDHDGNYTEKVEKKRNKKKMKTNVDDLGKHEGNNTEKVEKKKKKTNVDSLGNHKGNDTDNVEKKKKKTNVDDFESRDGNGMEKVEKKKKYKPNVHDLENYDGNDIEKIDKKENKKKKKTKVDDLDDHDGNNIDKVEKKKKKKQRTNVDNLDIRVPEIMVDENGSKSTTNEDDEVTNISEENGKKAKKKKKLKSIENDFKRPKSEGKSKKVRFSGEVEVFPLSEDPSSGKEGDQGEGLVRGKRFSPEEDEIVSEAVLKYIEEHQLGEEGIHMVMHCGSYPEIRNCWKEIGAVMPYRPYESIYHRAHVLFERAEMRGWTSEEIELVRKLHEEHGPAWRKMGDVLGKHRFHVKDTWRRIKLANRKRGRWSQDEYQNLFDLVNLDLKMKAFEEKKSKHGMLRDNICWGAISDKLSTRLAADCCVKWYSQLSSPMIAEGDWADVDDYRLVIALYDLDACCIEDVDWDTLLEHRSGDLCRKRWLEMVRYLGQHRDKSFSEQVDILLKRYCPDVLEAREIWDNKPVVP